MSAPSADVLVGQVLAGRYRLGEVLGRGGFATVFAAHDEALDREVALKVWHDPDAGATESRLTARLRHPGVVVVHDAYSNDDVSFLVMERVDGVSLDTELGLGPLSQPRTREVVGQLATTLALVHADGVVHGDVKPANVLLGRDDRVTLTDFGVAGPARPPDRDLTVGSPPYLSPEQVTGRPITTATDVYALGLVLLECLTAVRAFPGTPQESALARLSHGPQIPAYVPADLAELVREMTDLDPVRRPSASEVATRVRGERADTMLLAVPAAAAPVAVRQRWALVGAVLLAVVLGLALTGPHRNASTGTPTPTQQATPQVVAPPAPTSPPQHGKAKGHHKNDQGNQGD